MVCFWEERKPVGWNNTVPFPRSLMHSLPGRGRQFAICCKTPPRCLFVGYFALLCSETGSYGWCTIQPQTMMLTRKLPLQRSDASCLRSIWHWWPYLCFSNAAASMPSLTSTVTSELELCGLWPATLPDCIALPAPEVFADCCSLRSCGVLWNQLSSPDCFSKNNWKQNTYISWYWTMCTLWLSG